MNQFEINLFEYQKLFFHNDKIISIVVRGQESGEITVLYDHSPIILDLDNTTIKCKLSSGQTKSFWIEKGIFSFHRNVANVMVSKLEAKV